MKQKLILLLMACILYPLSAHSSNQIVTQTVSATAESSSEYPRDPEWLTMPTIATTDQKLNGLVAVYDNVNNYIAFSCAGAYTVDWGDGSSTENFATGVVAEHNFDYDDLSNTTTHSTEGYRQAIVQVTMQTSETLTAIDLDERHSAVGNERWQLNWLDIEIAGESITSFSIQSNEAPALMLKEFSMLSNSITSFSYMFESCYSLQRIPLLDTSSGTNFSDMFYYCSSLQTIPLLDTSSGTNFVEMFYYCTSLQTIPLLDTSSGTNFSLMFYSCYSLQTIPLLDTSSGTRFEEMFSRCSSLQTIPLLDTSSGTDIGSMFYACSSLQIGATSSPSVSITYPASYLTRGALVDIFNNLATVTATITITGNIGVDDLTAADRLIATGKGWTIVD